MTMSCLHSDSESFGACIVEAPRDSELLELLGVTVLLVLAATAVNKSQTDSLLLATTEPIES